MTIPPDILSQAKQAVAGHMVAGAREENEALVQSVAEALAAERERCAVITEMHDHQGVIAAAIRKGAAR